MGLDMAHNQWAVRPDDERFLSIVDLDNHLRKIKNRSLAKVISTRSITAVPIEGANHKMGIVGPTGIVTGLTHWSFGQLAVKGSAPANYLRSLPAPMAADCLNWGFQFTNSESNVGVLLSADDENKPLLRAMTGPAYGRIWNADISQALLNRFGDGITGDFRVPGEFGESVEITKANTTLYASDRDMFVFLADEKNRIEIPNRRDGKPGQMARGFFVWNSEVGASTFGIATFLFDYVCSNRMVWGGEGYKEIKVRHTSGAPEKWIDEIAPTLVAYAQSSTAGIIEAITAAKNSKVDADKIGEFLKSRFSVRQAQMIVQAHLDDEHKPMENLWEIANGITAYARNVPYQDERIAMERKAGDILSMAL